MKNLAGDHHCDLEIQEELARAGIGHFLMPEMLKSKGEVPYRSIGELGAWTFRRAWYYYVAEGPGLPPNPYANRLHAAHGKVVRVAGHCGCPSPVEWYNGLGVGLYHVDTLEGLKALADEIRLCMKEAVA